MIKGDGDNMPQGLSEPVPTVDHLNQSLSCILHVDLSKYMNPVTKVLGRVDTVSKAYGKYVYINLKGNESSLSVKCPASVAPQSGQNLVFEGRVGLKTNKLGGFSVELSGRPIQKMEAFVNDKRPVHINKSKYITLFDLMTSHDFESLGVMGSVTALKDVETAMGKSDVIVLYEVSTISKDSLLNGFNSLCQKHDGVMIVRGGDDDTLDIWDEPEFVKDLVDFKAPFYLGLGHSHKMTLANQFADESMPTPTAAGLKIQGVLSAIQDSRVLKNEIDSLTSSMPKLIRRAVVKSLIAPLLVIVLLCVLIFNLL